MMTLQFHELTEGQRFFYQGQWWTKRSNVITDSGSTANAVGDNGLITFVRSDEEVSVED